MRQTRPSRPPSRPDVEVRITDRALELVPWEPGGVAWCWHGGDWHRLDWSEIEISTFLMNGTFSYEPEDPPGTVRPTVLPNVVSERREKTATGWRLIREYE